MFLSESPDLIKAVVGRDDAQLDSLLDSGCNVDECDTDKYAWTALMWACDTSNVHALYSLVMCGADLDICDLESTTPLILACYKGCLEIVICLLNVGADINHVQPGLGWNGLMWCAQEGNADVASTLLDRGINGNIRDRLGYTPCILASQNGNIAVLQVLLAKDHNLQLDATTDAGWTALMTASKNGHANTVRLLLHHGASPSICNTWQVYALHIAAHKGHLEVAKCLCEHPDTPQHELDDGGKSAIDYAENANKLDVAIYLKSVCYNSLAIAATRKTKIWQC